MRTAQTAPDRTTKIETVDSSGNFHDADSKSGVTRAIVLVPALLPIALFKHEKSRTEAT